ncbi:MAG: shikimate dehydrogenase [candidate division KSB1 bacterium]|nr:shikimate dehydrogenase [candidate division KSB1 bacterium]MDQ7064477.1 shikimate dehydrogenase [candidate division KSB1 bacterium]
MPTSSKTGLLGVIGDPIAHSLSPTLHRFLIQEYDLPYCYHAFRVPAEQLEMALLGARALGVAGLNVTLPHKQAVMRWLDEIDAEAQAIGAVNTIVFRKGRLLGTNTDAAGFLQSLRESGVGMRGRTVLVLGAGGAARAVCRAVQQAEAQALLIYNRTRERAETLAAAFGGDVAGLEQAMELPAGSLVINATRVGMAPDVEASPLPELLFRPDCVYVDLVYNPLRTRFLQMAQTTGAATVDGLGMLIFQGVRSLEVWLEREFNAAEFYQPLREHLVSILMGRDTFGNHGTTP